MVVGAYKFFIAHWLLIFMGAIGAALLIVAVLAAIEEIGFRVERRRHRYRLAKKVDENRGPRKNAQRHGGRP